MIVHAAPWIEADVDEVRDDETEPGVRVVSQDRSHPEAFAFAFDARPQSQSAMVCRRPGAPQLVQSCAGTTVVCEEPRFDPEAIRVFDFRVTRPGRFEFGYLLPLDGKRAVCDVVETAAPPVEMAPLLDEYLGVVTGGTPHRRDHEE